MVSNRDLKDMGGAEGKVAYMGKTLRFAIVYREHQLTY